MADRLTAEDFLPGFRFARVIEDAHAGQVVQAGGVVRFRRDDAGLVYDESGQMHLPGHAPMQAERRYLWRFDGRGVEVLFDDGRPFHRFDPLGQGAGTDHLCGPDYYRVAYDFTDWPRWRAVWRVTGPRKDYESRTDYTPL